MLFEPGCANPQPFGQAAVVTVSDAPNSPVSTVELERLKNSLHVFARTLDHAGSFGADIKPAIVPAEGKWS